MPGPLEVRATKTAMILGSALLAAPIVFAAILLVPALGIINAEPGGCSQSADVNPTGKTNVSSTLKIKDPATTKISVGNGAGPAIAPIILELGPPDTANSTAPAGADKAAAAPKIGDPIKVHVDFLRRGTDSDVVVAADAHAEFTSPTTATVTICVARKSAKADSNPHWVMDPGEYSGAVTVVDPRLPVTTIPFTVALAYANWPFVLMCWCVIVSVGGVYIALIRQESEQASAGFKPLVTFLGTWLGVASFITGAAAALLVFSSAYLSSETWGAATSEWLTLVGAMFTALVTSATAFRFARVLPASPTRGPDAAVVDADAEVKVAKDVEVKKEVANDPAASSAVKQKATRPKVAAEAVKGQASAGLAKKK